MMDRCYVVGLCFQSSGTLGVSFICRNSTLSFLSFPLFLFLSHIEEDFQEVSFIGLMDRRCVQLWFVMMRRYSRLSLREI